MLPSLVPVGLSQATLNKSICVHVRQLRVEAALTGILPKERSEGQPLVVDAACWLPQIPSSSDADAALLQTVDYRAVCTFIEAQARRYHPLLEQLAESIAQGLLSAYPVIDYVCLGICKPQALPQALASVYLQRSRS